MSERPGTLRGLISAERPLIIVAVFVLAVGVRLLYMHQVSAGPLFNVFQTDARWHAEWAQTLAAGEWTEKHPFFRAPLYPLFLAGAYRLTGESFLGARVVQHLLGAISCVLVVLLGRRMVNAAAGALAGFICALYGPLIYFENELLIPSLAVFLFLAMLLALHAAAARPTAARWLFCGGLLGCSAITRPTFLVIAPAIVLWWLWKRRRADENRRTLAHVLVFGAGLMLPILPVTLHNRVIGGEWVLISTQGGANFYIGNHAEADGKTAVAFIPPAWVRHEKYVDNVWWSSRANAEALSGHPMTDSAVSRFWFARGLAYWRENPAGALGLTVRKVYYLLNGFEIESNRSMYLDRLWSPLAATLFWQHNPGVAFPGGVLLPLALIGMFLPARPTPLAGLPRWIIALYALTIVAFFVTGRFRIPLVPLLAIYAAQAVFWLIAAVRFRRYKQLRLAGAALVLLVVLSNSALWGVRDVDYARQASILGEAYYRAGQPGRAAAYLEEAVAADPNQFADHLDLARVQLELNRVTDAEASFRAVIALAPQIAPAHTGLGAALMAQDRPEEAIASLRTALKLDPRDGAAHFLLAELLSAAGLTDEARDHREQAERLIPGIDDAWRAPGAGNTTQPSP